MKMSYHSLANETNVHIKGLAPDLASKERPKAIRKWPIFFPHVTGLTL